MALHSSHLSVRHDINWLSHLAVAKTVHDFKNFAPRWELASAATLVLVHRSHELDLKARVITLAGGRVDLSSTFALAASVFTIFDIVIFLLLRFRSSLRYRTTTSKSSLGF